MKIEAASRLKEGTVVLAEDYDDYIDRLLRERIKRIGIGYHGAIFQHPTMPNVAVKVATHEDSVAVEWLKWCEKNPSPYVPKVYSVHKMNPEQHKGNYFVAFMEKLQHVSEQQILDFREHEGLTEVMVPDERALRFNVKRWELKVEALPSLKNPTLRKVLAKIKALSNTIPHVHGLDLTNENFMRRGNQVVFNDPVR